MAAAIVMMMVAGGLAIIPALSGSHAKAPAEVPAKTMAVGTRTASYTIDHIGESYIKNPDISNFQGNRTLTEGLNAWWLARNPKYSEYIISSTYPFVTAYPLESGFTKAPIDPGFGLTMMARMSIDAKWLPTMGTNAGMDPIFIPVLNKAAPGGGTVTLQLRSDYATPDEIAQLKAVSSTYFARVYYGAPRISLTDDGYFNEIYGLMTFDAPAAQSYLNLPGNTGNLMTEFTSANAGNAIGILWLGDMLTETGAGGIYNTEAGYEYANDIRQVVLTLDPSSTPTLLKVRLWILGWGTDVMLMRYFDVSGLNKYLESYFEDMYLNITVKPTWANITTSYYMEYAMEAWANPLTGGASWSLQAQHIDYVGTTAVAPEWVSKFNPYDPDVHPELTTMSYLPGTTHYGQLVNYYVTPLYWPLVSGETLTFKVPARTFAGYDPYVGTTDTLSATKVTEVQGHRFTGQAVLGHCTPDMTSNYNAQTKAVTFTGPTSYAREPSPQNPLLNNSGVPEFNVDVVRVTSYNISLTAGWNMISIPLVASYKASTLPGLVRGDTITEWNVTSQTYKTFLRGISPPSMDIVIKPSTGYWIYSAATKKMWINGTLASTKVERNVTMPASGTGWFMLGFVSLNPTMKAADIPKLYNKTGAITVVAMFDPVTKMYKTWLSAVPSMNNFALSTGMGFWAYCSASGKLAYNP